MPMPLIKPNISVKVLETTDNLCNLSPLSVGRAAQFLTTPFCRIRQYDAQKLRHFDGVRTHQPPKRIKCLNATGTRQRLHTPPDISEYLIYVRSSEK